MARDRRAEWSEKATDYALEHGLIGLSLRPLATALGTSDRMLIYHFGSKAGLVASVLRTSTDRSTEQITLLPPSASVRAAVLDLWRAMRDEPTASCSRLYVEAAALGLLGREPYASEVREANARWTTSLVDHVERSGVSRPVAERVVNVMDAAFMGFELDLSVDDPVTLARSVEDLADAVAALAL
jgi:AcrR family transcriptional regulator